MTAAVKTNGIGERSDYHLNLTRSLADVWADEYIVKPPKPPKRRKIGRPEGARDMGKRVYAGKD